MHTPYKKLGKLLQLLLARMLSAKCCDCALCESDWELLVKLLFIVVAVWNVGEIN